MLYPVLVDSELCKEIISFMTVESKKTVLDFTDFLRLYRLC